MAWVGARAFDTVGVTSFQALLAPLLVDSYDLEGRVFEEGIPDEMLEGVEELGSRRDRRAPGPDAKVLGVSEAVRPAPRTSRAGRRRCGERALRSRRSRLCATLEALPAGALSRRSRRLRAAARVRSRETGTTQDAKYVTANVNLWPRPLVIVMGKDVFDSLTAEQQALLRDAAAAAIPEALAASRAEDDEAAPELCRRGMTFAIASESELAELRSALEPVYAELTADPETKSDDRRDHRPQDGGRSLGRSACLHLHRAPGHGVADPGRHLRDDAGEGRLAADDERRLAEGRSLRGGGGCPWRLQDDLRCR